MLARYGGAFGVSAAIHAIVASALVWSTHIPGASSTREKPVRPVEVVLLPPSEDSQFPGLKPVDGKAGLFSDVKGHDEIAGADLDRIAAHLAVLFPFVKPGIAVDAFFRSIPVSSRLTFENPYVPPPATPVAQTSQPLAMDDAALQALVDRSWTRGNRWKAFQAIRQITLAGNADDTRLAHLLALYREQNALQPYADGAIRDLRLWAQLGLAADHVEFIGFIRAYAAAHPSTKVTTELLLLLDTLAQANADALAVLAETNQPGDLAWTQETHPRAYRLAREIQRVHARELLRLGLTTRGAIDAFYRRGRLSLLVRLLDTTPSGYRADDVRYLIGEILWTLDERADALRMWRSMTGRSPEAAYAVAIAQMRAAVQPPQPDARNIGYILRNQQGRWRSFSDDRLRRFGYRVDMY